MCNIKHCGGPYVISNLLVVYMCNIIPSGGPCVISHLVMAHVLYETLLWTMFI